MISAQKIGIFKDYTGNYFAVLTLCVGRRVLNFGGSLMISRWTQGLIFCWGHPTQQEIAKPLSASQSQFPWQAPANFQAWADGSGFLLFFFHAMNNTFVLREPNTKLQKKIHSFKKNCRIWYTVRNCHQLAESCRRRRRSRFNSRSHQIFSSVGSILTTVDNHHRQGDQLRKDSFKLSREYRGESKLVSKGQRSTFWGATAFGPHPLPQREICFQTLLTHPKSNENTLLLHCKKKINAKNRQIMFSLDFIKFSQRSRLVTQPNLHWTIAWYSAAVGVRTFRIAAAHTVHNKNSAVAQPIAKKKKENSVAVAAQRDIFLPCHTYYKCGWHPSHLTPPPGHWPTVPTR